MLHKNTSSLIGIINEFLKQRALSSHLQVTHCISSPGRKKVDRLDLIQLELHMFKENYDFRSWKYVLHFGVIDERYAESQELFQKLAEILGGAYAVEVDMQKMAMEIVIMEQCLNEHRALEVVA